MHSESEEKEKESIHERSSASRGSLSFKVPNLETEYVEKNKSASIANKKKIQYQKNIWLRTAQKALQNCA